MTKEILVSRIKVSELHFDHKNPRLAEYGITGETPEEKIREILRDAMDVRELVQSIAASGFFPHEALIVAEEDGKKVVIEGNRRLAAVKELLAGDGNNERGWEVPSLDKDARAALDALPTIASSREEAWRFLGFKHVNGPAEWSSYAKAAYIATVHKTFGVALTDIANQIGDRSLGPPAGATTLRAGRSLTLAHGGRAQALRGRLRRRRRRRPQPIRANAQPIHSGPLPRRRRPRPMWWCCTTGAVPLARAARRVTAWMRPQASGRMAQAAAPARAA